MPPVIGERTPSITVIIPTRNRLVFLREAVASVLSQSFGDWEMIVVDDCSQDGTWDWLQCLGDGRIRAVRMQEHRERSAARNAALREARGEYVLFLDDDDWLLEDALSRLFGALHCQPAAIGAAGAHLYKNSRGQWKAVRLCRRRCCRDISEELWLGLVLRQGQTLLRTSVVRDAGGWNENISCAEDVEIWVRLARFGPVVFIPEAVFAYREHPGQERKTNLAARGRFIDRCFMAGLAGQERQRAERCVRARRLIGLARRSYGNARLQKAAIYGWQAVYCAPWLLRSSSIRGPFLNLALRSSVGALLGRRGVLFWRASRRILAKRLDRISMLEPASKGEPR